MPPARKRLLDAGPLVAILSQRDKAHAKTAQYFLSCGDVQHFTTWSCITEAAHFVSPKMCALLLKRINDGLLSIVDVFDGVDRMIDLIECYEDQAPDLADISLIYAAEKAKITDIVTLDRTDFEVYRINGRTPFRIVGPE